MTLKIIYHTRLCKIKLNGIEDNYHCHYYLISKSKGKKTNARELLKHEEIIVHKVWYIENTQENIFRKQLNVRQHKFLFY